MNDKNPDLMFRYSKGLGDAVACLLHSRYLKEITRLITGKDKPCQVCSMRRNALNVLFPIPFWRFFFKNKEEAFGSLVETYKDQGFDVKINEDNQTLTAFSVEPANQDEIFFKSKNTEYKLVNDSESEYGDLIVKVQIYKK